jgi:hypothetical protein
MYAGYVFLCNTASVQQCVKRKQFACSAEAAETAEDIGDGSLVFLFNKQTNTLVGPFTAVASMKSGLEEGAWVEEVQEETLSEDFRVEWETLHELKNAVERFDFLKGLKDCKLDQFRTKDVLSALRDAPPYRQ